MSKIFLDHSSIFYIFFHFYFKKFPSIERFSLNLLQVIFSIIEIFLVLIFVIEMDFINKLLHRNKDEKIGENFKVIELGLLGLICVSFSFSLRFFFCENFPSNCLCFSSKIIQQSLPCRRATVKDGWIKLIQRIFRLIVKVRIFQIFFQFYS
jgi:hypothetical protein